VPTTSAPGVLTWVRQRDPVRWLLGLAVVIWSLTFFFLCKLRQDRFGTFAFDLGTYDQGVWLLAHFRMFDTVRGLNILGHHFNVILLVLAPFYRLGAGPVFLAAVQIAAQASGAIAVFLLARDRLADRWLALVLACALLLNPTYQFLTWEYFHPDAVAIGPVLFAYWAARQRRWKWFAVAALAAMACKEDVALVVGAIGILVFFRDSKRAGAVATAAAGVWYFVATRVVMKAFLGGLNPFYDSFFGELGNSFGSVVVNSVLKPATTFRLVSASDRISYYWRVFLPVGFIALASPSTMLVALPMLAVNALTTFPYARDYMYHYSALVVAGVMVATVEGIASLAHTRGARAVVVALVASMSLITSMMWGISPISKLYDTGYWPLLPSPRYAVEREALKIVPPQAPVSATYAYVPHLTHRPRIYNFPEPWKRVDWGVNGEGLHNPSVVQWIVVDRQVLNGNDRALVQQLLDTQFTTRFDKLDVLVAQRTAPGGRL
jgi:uncharacterized membrane protein